MYFYNLYAFILPLFLFIYWGMIGYATLDLFYKKNDILKKLLLAPISGFCITLLSVFTLNRLGLPVINFAKELCLLLLFSSMLILLKPNRIFSHLRYYLGFMLIILLSLCIVGYPLLLYGFDWLSFSNDDMNNYCLGALRFLNHGYFDLPNVKSLISGSDYSLYYWFIHVPGMARPGSELILAWLSGVTRLNILKIFMIQIVTGHMMLVSTTGALVCQNKQKRSLALTTCFIFTFSALSIFGVLYQLIAQVFGLSLLIALLVLLLKPFKQYENYKPVSYSILISIILASFLITYPEILPFVFFTFIAYYSLMLIKGWRPDSHFFKIMLFILCFTVFFINTHVFSVLEYINVQVTKGTSESVTSIFPYYFLPSGIANLWGFIPITFVYSEPWHTILISLCALLSVMVLITSCKLIFKRSIAALVTLIMAVFGVLLFMKHFGFGLFKLAMYCQPFMIAVLTYSLFEIFKNRKIRNYIVISITAFSFFSIYYYIARSKALTPGPFTEVAYGSNTKIKNELETAISSLPNSATLFTDDFNVSVIKLQAFMSYPHPIIFLTAPPIFTLRELKGYEDYDRLLPAAIYKKLYSVNESTKFKDIINASPKKIFFKLFDAGLKNINLYQISTCENNSCKNSNDAYLLADTSLRSVINKRYSTSPTNHNFTLLPLKAFKNHLIYTDSSLGKIYYSPYAAYYNLPIISLYNIEPDYMYKNNNMQGIGRLLAFQIINPSNQFRIELAITNTFDGNRDNKLLSIDAIGNKRVKFLTMGRGSARVFSPPLSSQTISGSSYIVLDLSNGLFSKLNKHNSVIDNRQIITYSRDISLISEADYHNLHAPGELNKFPDDLANNDLEYSGIYEDGWISENSFFKLTQANSKSSIVIRGMIPKIGDDFTTTITVSLDGKNIFKQLLHLGTFDIKIPTSTDKIGPKKIEIHFDKFQFLPNGDGRPVVALINKIGFV